MELDTVQTFNSCTSRPDVCHCLVVQIPIDNMSKNNQSTSMTHVACESKLRSVVRSFIHPWPWNRVTIGRAVVYYARTAYAFSAGIKCRHCRCRVFSYFCNNRDNHWASFLHLQKKHDSIIYLSRVRMMTVVLYCLVCLVLFRSYWIQKRN